MARKTNDLDKSSKNEIDSKKIQPILSLIFCYHLNRLHLQFLE